VPPPPPSAPHATKYIDPLDKTKLLVPEEPPKLPFKMVVRALGPSLHSILLACKEYSPTEMMNHTAEDEEIRIYQRMLWFEREWGREELRNEQKDVENAQLKEQVASLGRILEAPESAPAPVAAPNPV
jgi:hypothetical protein